MGILDRIKGLFGTAQDAVSTQDQRGPLGLSPGDGVGYYNERFAVTGLRVIEGDGVTTTQYVLRDRQGQRAVLVAEEGVEQTLSLQRIVDAQVDWQADVLDTISDEPFHLQNRGQRRMRSFSDAPTASARSVTFRHYADRSAERIIALEDFGGHREVRVGEPVFEPELQLVRSGEHDTHSPGEVDAEDQAAADAATRSRGSPVAAALALAGRNADDITPLKSPVPRPKKREEDSCEIDPTAYDDERWADETDGTEDNTTTNAPCVEDFVDSEEDEWVAAAQFLREQNARHSSAESIP